MTVSFARLGDIADVSWGNTSITKASYTSEGYTAFSASGADGFLPDFEHEGPGIVLSAIGARCGRCFAATGKWIAIKNTITITPNRSKRVHFPYLLHYVSQENIWSSRGGGQPFIGLGTARDLLVPHPPISEQKRIADILDKADTIRRKRQDAVYEIAGLRRSLFLSMFGDPATNVHQWPEREFETLLEGGLRNGISPSREGKYHGKVLILSAITGTAFDKDAIKEGTFASEFGESQLVNLDDFLICRGNGNLNLVGKGRFSTIAMANVVFPDTMIAARINRGEVYPEYLEELWETRHIRGQIEAGARTTNGTYKINQTLLSTILIPVPPIALQEKFSATIKSIQRIFDRMSSSLPLDLFNSLVQRAFRGEL